MDARRPVFIPGPPFGPRLNWIIRKSGLNRLLFWLVWKSGIPLPGKLAPWLLGLAIGYKPNPVVNPPESKE